MVGGSLPSDLVTWDDMDDLVANLYMYTRSGARRNDDAHHAGFQFVVLCASLTLGDGHMPSKDVSFPT